MEGPAARAYKPLSAQPSTASQRRDTEALDWKRGDMREERVVPGNG